MTAILLNKKDIALYLLSLCFLSGYSQGNKTIWFHSLKKEFGLPSNSIFSYVRDSRGFLWLGSSGGLCRFDGASVRYYYAEKPDMPKIVEKGSP